MVYNHITNSISCGMYSTTVVPHPNIVLRGRCLTFFVVEDIHCAEFFYYDIIVKNCTIVQILI